jgi:hypothetical protein
METKQFDNTEMKITRIGLGALDFQLSEEDLAKIAG